MPYQCRHLHLCTSDPARVAWVSSWPSPPGRLCLHCPGPSRAPGLQGCCSSSCSSSSSSPARPECAKLVHLSCGQVDLIHSTSHHITTSPLAPPPPPPLRVPFVVLTPSGRPSIVSRACFCCGKCLAISLSRRPSSLLLRTDRLLSSVPSRDGLGHGRGGFIPEERRRTHEPRHRSVVRARPPTYGDDIRAAIIGQESAPSDDATVGSGGHLVAVTLRRRGSMTVTTTTSIITDDTTGFGTLSIPRASLYPSEAIPSPHPP